MLPILEILQIHNIEFHCLKEHVRDFLFEKFDDKVLFCHFPQALNIIFKLIKKNNRDRKNKDKKNEHNNNNN